MKLFFLSIFILTNLFAAEPHQQNRHNSIIHTFSPSLNRVGDYPYPNDPLLDRAKGYLLKGKAKTAVSNSGNFITWDYHPAGFWGEYGYLPHLGFIAGVPGHEYSSNWSNTEDPSWMQESFSDMLWYSTEAYNAWVKDIADPINEVGNYKTVVYNTVVDMGNDDRGHNDRGIIATEIVAYCTNTDIFANEDDCEYAGYDWILPGIAQIDLTDGFQWFLDHELGRLYLYTDDSGLNPNYASAGIGLAFPWAIRPKFKSRNETAGGFYFDQYEYGDDGEEWTDDDEYVYYGANTAESWFIRDSPFGSPAIKTDWQATTEARYNTHNLDNTAGDLFGNTEFAVASDPDLLLAHSRYPATWPTKYSIDTGSYEPFWPGWWADEYYGDSPASWSSVGIYDCNGTHADDGCWKPLPGRHISDMDVYMEFDDRWANVGNVVVDNEYVSSGYPMGIKVMATGHSYEFQIAEDMVFFTVKVRNESGDYCAFERDKNQIKIPVEDGNGFIVCEDGMIMPDGTKLNRGKGFDYKKLYLGFYMDADVLYTDATGGFSVHTNEDDFMQYFDCKISNQEYPDGCPTVNGDTLRISMAVIGDYDGYSNAARGYSMETGENKGYDFGVVAVQLLDSPYSTGYVDLDLDGIWDIYPGEKLKMTDWHWFDWYSRPGVLALGASDNPAQNKELIQYQLMAGDNTNLTEPEKWRYFHSDNPDTDYDSEINPHFDSLEGLEQTSYFQSGAEGLDALLQMTTGPFDLEVGEQVNMSFVVLFGQNIEDLKENAETAQILYNNHYSVAEHPSAPKSPEFTATAGDHSISIEWDDVAENSIDYLTGEQDFQGYKIYRSLDHGETWGDSVYNINYINPNYINNDICLIEHYPAVGYNAEKALLEIEAFCESLPSCDWIGNKCQYSDENYCDTNDSYCEGMECCGADGCCKNDIDGIVNYNKADCNLLSSINNHIWLPDIYLNQSTCEEEGFIWQDVNHGFEDYSYKELCEDSDHEWVAVEYLDELSCESAGYEWVIIDFIIEDGVHIGWEPIAQFDLNDDISGPDPLAPWFNLGDNTGLEYSLVDSNLFPYNKYCYSVTAYDSGLDPGYDDNEWFNFEGGYEALESSMDASLVCMYPAYQYSIDTPVDVLFSADVDNIGSSYIDYVPHSVDIDEKGLYRFEIQAEIDTNTYLNSKTLNPKLFVFEVDGYGTASVESTLYVGSISEDSLNILIDMPGTEYDSVNDSISIPDYLVQDFSIYSIDDSASTDNWLYILGMYVKIENFNALINNPFALVEFEDVIFSDTLLSEIIDIKMRYKSFSDFVKQPYFDYQIEFGTAGIDTAVLSNTPDDVCIVSEHALLPFKITNITTGNKVNLEHKDSGLIYGSLIFGESSKGGCNDADCEDGEECLEGRCVLQEGFKNCNWERNEYVEMVDKVFTDADLEGSFTKIFELKINFNFFAYALSHEPDFFGEGYSTTGWNWISGQAYEIDDLVYYEGMLYRTNLAVSDDIPPNYWFDDTEDNINDNPWQILYPWEDGDSATIITVKKLHDGDSWLVNISKIGDDLGNINQAVPNEYSLKNPYPNPFNPVTRIEYSLPNTINVSIIIYDLLGRQVEVLQSEVMNPGKYHVVWDASQYSSGLYFVKMIAGKNIQTQKLMLIK